MSTVAELPQHMQALQEANRIRFARIEVARALDRGDRTVADVLERIPDELQNWPLGSLLRAQRRWGRTRARRFCSLVGINELRVLGDLTLRQRSLISGILDGRDERPWRSYDAIMEEVTA